VTWSIFELENTSGTNYISIWGRSSVVEATVNLHGYRRSNGML
jgi:hypothetical protein